MDLDSQKMEHKTKLLIFICCLTSLTFLACDDKKTSQKLENSTEIAQDNFKEFFLKGVEKGKKIWDLTGESAVIGADSSSQNIKIINPKVLFYDEDKNELVTATLEAKEADVNTDTKNMKATGDVKIVSFKDNTKIFTEEIFFDKKLDVFYSEEFVRIEQGKNITTGIGFDSRSDLSEINIKKDVKIWTEPNEKNLTK